MAKLRAAPGLPARALELCILTATRSGEVLNASWDEFDLDGALWTIPGERMKAGKAHAVPLCDRAVAILRDLHRRRLSDWVFPGRAPRRPLSNMAMTMAMRRLEAGEFTVHGFRSSFRDWAGDATNFPRDVAEAALAHTLQGVEAAYRRASALEKRRRLMDAWARYLATTKGGDNVRPIRKAGLRG